jgi:hypothetical protein
VSVVLASCSAKLEEGAFAIANRRQTVQETVLAVIARGQRWFNQLASGRAASIRENAKREGL